MKKDIQSHLSCLNVTLFKSFKNNSVISFHFDPIYSTPQMHRNQIVSRVIENPSVCN